jgi:hypothetical protein
MELVANTVYELLLDGDTTKFPPVMVYVAVPFGLTLGVKVMELPKQILPLFTETVGVMYTVTLHKAVLVATQPWALVPVTLYVVLTNGDTIGEPLE